MKILGEFRICLCIIVIVIIIVIIVVTNNRGLVSNFDCTKVDENFRLIWREFCYFYIIIVTNNREILCAITTIASYFT